ALAGSSRPRRRHARSARAQGPRRAPAHRGAAGRPSRRGDDADPARLWSAADVVRERDGGLALHLALLGLALQLLVVLVDHTDAGGARRMAEGLEAAVGVHREVAAELEGAALHVVLGRALLAEAQVLVGEELGQREAVMDLRDVNLLSRVGDAGLRVH